MPPTFTEGGVLSFLVSGTAVALNYTTHMADDARVCVTGTISRYPQILMLYKVVLAAAIASAAAFQAPAVSAASASRVSSSSVSMMAVRGHVGFRTLRPLSGHSLCVVLVRL